LERQGTRHQKNVGLDLPTVHEQSAQDCYEHFSCVCSELEEINMRDKWRKKRMRRLKRKRRKMRARSK